MKVSIEEVESVLAILVIFGALVSYGKYRYEFGISPYSPSYKGNKKKEKDER